MISATMAEAQERFVELMGKVEQGETVQITAGEENRPVALLTQVPLAERAPGKGKRLGAMLTPGFVMPESFWEPLPEDELRLWNGEGE